MEKFTSFKSTAAPLGMVNVDTDMILPKQHLRVVTRAGLGKFLFQDLRYKADGAENPDFILNRAPYRTARILIAGENFGCGSSREHAVWALMDFGIRCVIAPSFGDIFYNNCTKNGILPLILPAIHADTAIRAAEEIPETLFTVDLEAQRVSFGNRSHGSEIDPFRKRCLLEGLDEIALTLERKTDITAYEEKRRAQKPWLETG